MSVQRRFIFMPQQNKSQKIAVIILAVFAVLIVVFWVWQIRAQINQPFTIGGGASVNSTSTDMMTILKNQDTDGDGLTDYEEIYTYKTSPYLEDTDSDGISDNKEVDQGTDPNCPQGQNCQATTETASSSAPVTSLSPTATLSASSTNETILQSALNGQINAAALRQLLISSGASKTDLDKISDEDLMTSYQETLKNQNQNAQ
jgi:hypothetical protein